MSGEITLPVGATAEPGTCGACRSFRRWEGQDHGLCTFVLPPFKDRYALRPKERDDDTDYLAPNDVRDTARCDLYRHDGKVYIVQRIVRSGPG